MVLKDFFVIGLGVIRSTLICKTGAFELGNQLASKEESVRCQAGSKPKLATIANDLDDVRMKQRLTPDERDPHRAQVADFANPEFEIFEGRMRAAIVVFCAIAAVEIAPVRNVKAALEWFPVEQTLA